MEIILENLYVDIGPQRAHKPVLYRLIQLTPIIAEILKTATLVSVHHNRRP